MRASKGKQSSMFCAATVAVMCAAVNCAGNATEPPANMAEDPAPSTGEGGAPHVARDAAAPATRDGSWQDTASPRAGDDGPLDAAAPDTSASSFDVAAPDTAAATGTKVTTYDVKTDWSDDKNPNGVWSLREGTNVITPSVANWHGYKGQRAWSKAASGSGHIPVFLKIAIAGFEAKQAQIGDLIVHAQDEFGGPGLGQAQIVWTAPASGTVDIKGGLWLGRTTLGRSDDWTLSVAGAQKATGKVAANDGHDRTNPVPIAESNLPVSAGQTVVLQISRSATCANNHTCAEFCDLLLTITLTTP